MLWPDWRCQGFLLGPLPSPVVYGQLARMCLWGHPKFNPWEHRNSGESFSRFLSPHPLFMGTRPGFCSGTHGLYQLSADLYSPPENGILNGSLRHSRISLGVIPDHAEAGLWGWAVPNWVDLQAQLRLWITKPVFASLKKITSLLDSHWGREMNCHKNDFLKFPFNGLTCECLMRLGWSIRIFLVEKLILSYLYWNNWHCISHRSLGYKINYLVHSCRK